MSEKYTNFFTFFYASKLQLSQVTNIEITLIMFKLYATFI